MALSVATGTPCLGKYAVPEPGPVLVYLAEDALRVVGERIEGMARHRGLDIDQVAIYAITASALRLDHDRDRTRLWEKARWLRPKLLVLDPLVRLHGIDENHAGAVAELLGYFRSLQRQLGISVLLVHHTRKNTGDGAAAGQGLRGSGDIHAFGDSNLYLRRTEQHLIFSSEHRSAPASAPVYLKLVATNLARWPGPALTRQAIEQPTSACLPRAEVYVFLLCRIEWLTDEICLHRVVRIHAVGRRI